MKNTPSSPQPATAAKLAQAVQWHQSGQLQQAAAAYLEIIAVEPDHFDANHLLGVFAYQNNDLQAAYDLMQNAIKVRADEPQVHANFCLVLQALGRLDEALQSAQRALALAPRFDVGLNACAAVLQAQKRYAESIPYLERILQDNPQHLSALNNLGFALVELRRLDEALVCLDHVLALAPDRALALFNRGNALVYQNRLDEALAAYQRGVQIAPDNADIQFGIAVCHLLAGRFEAAWQSFAWRWRKAGVQQRSWPAAQLAWDGQASLQGKSILLYNEQGFGDTLQFCRYATVLAGMGATVVLQVQPALVGLLKGLDGVSQVVAENDAAPPCDYRCALMGLPAACATRIGTIPAARAYLAPDASRFAAWRDKLGPAHRPRVGICWSGNREHANDEARSIGMVDFQRALGQGIDFVALQKDMRAVDRMLVEQHDAIRSFSSDQHDFADTAALVAQMDLVVTVDTSIAHLAGAMGKPVWILLPFAPDWRWMLDRADSPWYPSATLLRQPRQGDWGSVLEELAQRLSRMVKT